MGKLKEMKRRVLRPLKHRREKETQKRFECVPFEIWEKIFLYLDRADILAVRATCKDWEFEIDSNTRFHDKIYETISLRDHMQELHEWPGNVRIWTAQNEFYGWNEWVEREQWQVLYVFFVLISMHARYDLSDQYRNYVDDTILKQFTFIKLTMFKACYVESDDRNFDSAGYNGTAICHMDQWSIIWTCDDAILSHIHKLTVRELFRNRKLLDGCVLHEDGITRWE